MAVLTLAQFWAANGQPQQQGVAKVVEKYSKLAARLPVKKVQDLKYAYGKEKSLGTVVKRVINKAFGEGKGSTVDPQEERMQIIGRPVKTDHLLAGMHPEARADEQARATRAIAREADDILLNGDSAAAADTINGLKARCLGNQLIWAGDNGAALTLAMFEAMIDATVDQGNGKLAVMNKTLYRQLKRLILAEAGGAAVMDVTGEIAKYEDTELLVIGDKNAEAPPAPSVLAFDETRGNSNATASMYCIAPGNDDVELSGVKLLQATNGISIIEEGIRDSMYCDVVEFAFGLVVYDDTAATRLGGLLAQ